MGERRHRPRRASASSSSVAPPASAAAPRWPRPRPAPGSRWSVAAPRSWPRSSTTAGTGTGISADVTDPDGAASWSARRSTPWAASTRSCSPPAVSPLAPLEEIDAQTRGSEVIATNAIAPALVAQAARRPPQRRRRDHLPLVDHRWAVGTTASAAYQASKAALDRTVQSWRAERPERRFVCMAVGDTDGHRVRTRLRHREGGGAVPEVGGVERDLREPDAGRRPRRAPSPSSWRCCWRTRTHHPRAHHRARRAG